MKKPQLTKEEIDIYIKIAKRGDIDMMFDFAYLVGMERFLKEQLSKIKNNEQHNKKRI